MVLPPGRARLSTNPAPTGSRNLREDDRHGAGRLQQRRHGRGAAGQDDVRPERNQFRRISADALGVATTPAIVDPHVAAIGPTQLLQIRAGTPRYGSLPSDRLQWWPNSTPTRRIRSSARAPRAAIAAALPSTERIRRRRMSPLVSADDIVTAQTEHIGRGQKRLRFCNMKCWPMSEMGHSRRFWPIRAHVRFTPESDRFSGQCCDVRKVPCVDGSELARAFFTFYSIGRCSHVFGL